MNNQAKKNKFSLEDISIIKQDCMNTDELSNIMGGFWWSGRSCKCKCASGNCFKDREVLRPSEPEPTPAPEPTSLA